MGEVYGHLLPDGRLVEISGSTQAREGAELVEVAAMPSGYGPFTYDRATRRAIPHAALIAEQRLKSDTRGLLEAERRKGDALALAADGRRSAAVRAAAQEEADRAAAEVARLEGEINGA